MTHFISSSESDRSAINESLSLYSLRCWGSAFKKRKSIVLYFLDPQFQSTAVQLQKKKRTAVYKTFRCCGIHILSGLLQDARLLAGLLQEIVNNNKMIALPNKTDIKRALIDAIKCSSFLYIIFSLKQHHRWEKNKEHEVFFSLQGTKCLDLITCSLPLEHKPQ